ncbi:class I SAM-dependent methyltransferase [Microbacterium azadirachtae]|uniref:Malonyl-[acyl-carrier protein] O-methyltransferase n=1 Tax=Microbacterium azadirachtae TaxID=582680 RepID=A0A0F0KIV0_9MICO|nr:class I SAM-dependent methyltransferase [Microbacterium azadirachtae]KJL20817.1 Malonyl-[acyl-carrier protein] O-methyltransferase [Microbacterium azadirachtae]UXW86976.1 class I SAM-dependent methyltransferase [Microbacterium azadirachtae]SDM28826.1 Methyltransferase domain-containing protein [Microbacterium azadirachtae]SEG48367.1 Methyltransferase domain-containing protein [Microbacterium azadirachtae]SEG51563.1 Methyltransferase domain-containing protein [Microbacterium azadirachtae]
MVERATSFGSETGSYEKGRPEYPAEAVQWLLEPLPAGDRAVVDIGAGTGKLTRAVLALGSATVTAVDPDPQMLDALRGKTPGVETVTGTAEELPLDDAIADAAVLGQAWHWVEPVAASAEIGRVLRPGGVLGLIWNVRDDRTGWVRRLTAIMHGSPAEEMIASNAVRVASPFGPLEEKRWEWTRTMTRAELHAMARSRSYLITAPEEEKDRVARGMDALFDELGLAEGGTLEMPYVTAAYRAVRGS